MASLSKTYKADASYNGAVATATATATIAYTVSSNNTTTTVQVSKLVISSITTSSSGGTTSSKVTAENLARSNLNNDLTRITFSVVFDNATIKTRTGASAGATYTSFSGSKGTNRGHSARTVSLVFNGTSAAISVPVKPSYTVSYNANSGSGAPAAQTKWYGESLSLSTTKPTKLGYTFKGWATNTVNAGNGVVNYSIPSSYTGNAALSLYAVWELNHVAPTISNISIERCDVNGNNDDEGTYAKVNFDWSVFISNSTRYYGGNSTTASKPYASNTISNATVTVMVDGTTLTESFDTTTTLPIIIGDNDHPLDTDDEYVIYISITDSPDSSISSLTTTASGILSRSGFPMDFNADATAVGFFRAAPDNQEGMFIRGKVYIDSRAINDKQFGIGVTPGSGDENIDVGWSYDNKEGAGIGLRSSDYSGTPGAFSIYAQNTTQGPYSLNGNPNGQLQWGGDLYLKGHSSSIGTVKYASLSSNKSVPHNTGTALCSISLDAGTWIMIAGVRWQTNTSGQRRICITTTSGATDLQMTAAPTSGVELQMIFPRVQQVTTTQTWYLNGYQTSGSALNAIAGGSNWGTFLTAIRII